MRKTNKQFRLPLKWLKICFNCQSFEYVLLYDKHLIKILFQFDFRILNSTESPPLFSKSKKIFLSSTNHWQGWVFFNTNNLLRLQHDNKVTINMISNSFRCLRINILHYASIRYEKHLIWPVFILKMSIAEVMSIWYSKNNHIKSYNSCD